jgi:O-antigen biosynthesis protein
VFDAGRMISVIIPARNAARTISSTLRSLVADRALIGEILLIDDGSQDGTAAIACAAARRFALPLIVTSVRCGGAGAARNAGLVLVRGEHIFHLDADDEVIAGGLSLLHEALRRSPAAGLAIGASIRRAEGRVDKTKLPYGYTPDRSENARKYLANEMWPIAMGSALIVAEQAAGLRFPETIGLDEDTCYWAALLTRVSVVMIDAPVLLYNLDEARMAERFTRAPRKLLLGISLELDRLKAFGIGRDILQWRKAWLASRIARQLIQQRQYGQAAGMLRAMKAHPGFRLTWKTFRYGARIRAGRLARTLGLLGSPTSASGSE